MRENLNRRKSPQQRRSEHTMGAILDAAAMLLIEKGYERLTTDEVAMVAGVSIGSIYEYFSGKEAIIAELRRRHCTDVAHALEKAANLPTATSLGEVFESVIRANVAVHAADAELHLLLAETYVDVGREPGRDEPRLNALAGSKAFIEYLTNHAGLSRPKAETAARVVSVTIEALTHAGVLHGELMATTDDLVDEICAVIRGYLKSFDIPWDSAIDQRELVPNEVRTHYL